MQWRLEEALAVGSALPWAALRKAGAASLLFSLWDVSRSWQRGQGELCHRVLEVLAWHLEPPALQRPSVPVLRLLLHPNHVESFVHCFSVL